MIIEIYVLKGKRVLKCLTSVTERHVDDHVITLKNCQLDLFQMKD